MAIMRWVKLAALLLIARGGLAATPTEIHAQVLRGGMQVLLGEGSNVVVLPGADGTLLVDDEYASWTARLRSALTGMGAPAVKLIINTHWHNDHTGGNEAFGRDGALIVAQENAARRMQSDQRMSLYGPQPAYPPIAWPKMAVEQSLHLRWNGGDIDVLHLGPAHTDSDLVVFFRQQDVLATGDLFVGIDYRPPYFDDLNGGSAEGMIAATERLLALADAHTIIVPGHGAPTDRGELQRYRDQLIAIRGRIREAIGRGLSEDEVVALHPVQDFAAAGKGTDRWARILYREYHR